MTDPITLARRAVACPRWCWMPGMLALVVETFLVRDNGGWCREDGTWGADPPPRWRRRLHGAPEHDDWNAEDGWPPYEDAGYLSPDPLPDIDDPATLGCILALVREAWTPAWVELMREGDPADGAWGYVSVEVDGGAGARCFWSHTDDGWAEALVLALEAAP